MSKFKVGDKVLQIEPAQVKSHDTGNNVMTIAAVAGDELRFKEDDETFLYDAKRYKNVTMIENLKYLLKDKDHAKI